MDLKVLGQDSAPEAAESGCASSSCGSTNDQLSHLPEAIREKVHNHPCYSEQAHHYYARMHVAVAPACNIQCHYCNRKYDCANESRPGVVSELLQPDQAVRKVMAVAANVPQMTVLGIAGPGDPLANPERTFQTFRELTEKAPDIKLCVSTNGLALPDCVDELAKHNVDHVTITINCVDPDVGAKIYPWIFWKNRRIRGRKAAEILIERQQKGLEMLTERGILVKVNSVMIPGVNDEHLKEVNRVVQSKGAFLHNIMPLIAEAEHGTFYGVMGQRGPTPTELQTLQEDCAGGANLMKHCRQCRADAVGMLGEDRGQEFTMDKVDEMQIDYDAAMEKRAEFHAAIESNRDIKAAEAEPLKAFPDMSARPVLMAIASKGQGVINQHFGHASEFMVYKATPEGVEFIGHRKAEQYCVGSDTCDDEGEDKIDRIVRALEGCEAVLCAKIGMEPWDRLEGAGIQPNGEHALEEIEEAVWAVYHEMYEAGQLAEAPTAAALSA